MPLLAVTSRLAHTASLISQTCSANTKPPGPFTHALLGNVPIIDIIRDADESERKLVRLEGEDVGRREVGVNGMGKAKVRKAAGGGERGVNGVGTGEDSVEVLAGAALELVEEYDSMPRARQHILSLLERSAALHDSIGSLQAQLAAGRPASPEKPSQATQATLQDVESSVRDLESIITATRQKRDTLRSRLRDVKHAMASPSSGASPALSSDATPRADEDNNPFLSRNPLGRSIGFPSSAAAAGETSVSSTSTAEGIMREESPLNTRSAHVRRGILGLEEEGEDEPLGEKDAGDDSFEDLGREDDDEPESLLDEMGEPELDLDEADEDEEAELDEPTIIMRPAAAPVEVPEPEPEPEGTQQAARNESKITPPMEIALSKIWSTSAGQCLDPTVPEGSSLSPKETFALLNTLLIPPSPPHSPLRPSSVSSSVPNASHPTADTILLARLFLNLLASPSLMIPLNSLKDQLKKFATERGFEDPGEKALRGVYSAVGRGVVRIDRVRGVVLFA